MAEIEEAFAGISLGGGGGDDAPEGTPEALQGAGRYRGFLSAEEHDPARILFEDVRLACALHGLTSRRSFQASRLSILPEDVLDRIFSIATPAYVARLRPEHGENRPPPYTEDPPSVPPSLPPSLLPLATRQAPPMVMDVDAWTAETEAELANWREP